MTDPDPTVPEPIDAAGLRQKVQVLIGALAAEVLRLREENERLRGQVVSAVDAAQPVWSGEMADLKAAAEGLAETAKEVDRWMLVIESAMRADAPRDHRAVLDALKANVSALTLYRAATSGDAG